MNIKNNNFHKNHDFLLNGYTVMLALTYDCQCNCMHCGAAESKKNQKEELSKKEIFKIIDDCRDLGAETIYFFGGEPLLVPELFKYIKHAKKNDLLTRLDTNGYLLNKNMVLKIKNSGLDFIRVSLDSPHAEIHDQLRGVKGLFLKAIDGIKLCIKNKIDCCISTYVTKKTLINGDVAKIIDLGKSLGVKIRLLTPICIGKWKGRGDLILNESEIKLLRNFLEKDFVSWEKIDNKNMPFTCRALNRELIYISAYGDIQPCCYWPRTFGNVKRIPLKSIIKKMQKSDILSPEKILNDCPVNYL